jgi:hypothetical protein
MLSSNKNYEDRTNATKAKTNQPIRRKIIRLVIVNVPTGSLLVFP